MAMRKKLTSDEAERVFETRKAQDPHLEALQGVLGEIRASFAEAPAPDVRARHLETISKAFGQADSIPVAKIPSRRGRMARRTSVAVAGLVLVGGSALAATGSLPAAAQDAISSAAHHIGLDLPSATSSPKPHHSPSPQNSPAAAFVKAKRVWTDCVAQHHGGNSDHGDC